MVFSPILGGSQFVMGHIQNFGFPGGPNCFCDIGFNQIVKNGNIGFTFQLQQTIHIFRIHPVQCQPANLPIRRETGRFCAGRGTMHKVRIEGLESGCDYCYEVISVNGDDVLASPKYPFRTAPDAESAISFLLTAECCGAEEPKPNTNPYTRPLNELMKQEHGSSFVLMEGLKKMMDPNGIMNPGTLIPLE